MKSLPRIIPLIIFIILFALYFSNLGSVSAANPDPTNPTDNRSCTRDNEGNAKPIAGLCKTSHPECIQNICYQNKNRYGYVCGKDSDCTTNNCDTSTNTCTDDSANNCQQFTTPDSCTGPHGGISASGRTVPPKYCFWYMGHPVDGQNRARCVDNNSNRGSSCGTGFCYTGQSFCLSDSLGSYCSSTSLPPPSSQKPDCSLLDDALGFKGGYAICQPLCNSNEKPRLDYSCSARDVENNPFTCCQGSKIGNPNVPSSRENPVKCEATTGWYCSPIAKSGDIEKPGLCDSPLTDICYGPKTSVPSNKLCGQGGAEPYSISCDINNAIVKTTPLSTTSEILLQCADNETCTQVDTTCAACVPKTSQPSPTRPGTDGEGGGTKPSIACTAPVHQCATEANRPAGYSYVDSEANRAALDAACGGGNVFCWTKTTSSGGSNPGGGTNPPADKTGPATGPCALEKGGIDTAKGTGGYDDAYCDKQPYSATKAQAGAFCNAVYTDHYYCKNTNPATGKPFEDWVPTTGTNPCAANPWCPSNSGAVCTDGSKKPIDCAAIFAGNYTCTYDYNSTDVKGTTHCCPDGKRYCPTVATCVPESQGCDNIKSQIGITCLDDRQCVDYAAGARCLPPSGGARTCQWPAIGSPTPTPGSVSTGTCAQQMGPNGIGGSVGCECGRPGNKCAPWIGCYPGAGSNMITGKFYCSPGVGTWCENSRTTVSDPNLCATTTPYVTPTPGPKDLGYQVDCPSDGNTCLQACTAPYVEKRAFGPGGTNGDRACSEYKTGGGSMTGWKCCTLPAGSPVPAPGTGNPQPPTGSTIPQTCAGSQTEHCQAGLDGNTNETCITGWDNIGKKNCTLNTTCCKQR